MNTLGSGRGGSANVMRLNGQDTKDILREILLGFWKVHILHHAATGPVVGQWMLTELRRHGYDVSPGTLYPMLKRMEDYGWLRCEVDPEGGLRARRSYFLTKRGKQVLAIVRRHLAELYREVMVMAAVSAASIVSACSLA